MANQGGSDTAVTSWRDDVYADTRHAGWQCCLLGPFTHTGLLNPGDDYSQSQLLTLPIDLLGSYNLFVVADASGDVSESDRSNNDSAPLPIVIKLTLPGGGGGGGSTGGGGTGGGGTGNAGTGNSRQARVSDLQPMSVTGPGIAVTAGSLTLDWNVGRTMVPGRPTRTTGTTTSGCPRYPTFGSGGKDISVGSVQHTNPLASGDNYSASGTFTVPRNTAAGNYHFIVVTNATGLVYETDSSNDALASSTTVSVTPGPIPDLTVSDVTVPSTATSGGQVAVGWTVANVGGETGDVPITDSVYLSYDQILDLTDRYLLCDEQGA